MTDDLHHLLAVYAAYVIAAGSPGPSNMAIMGVAMGQGRRPAVLVAAGVMTGSIFWGLMAATGVSAILTTYAHALFFLKIFGGGYLLYLAARAARNAIRRDRPSMPPAQGAVPKAPAGALYRRGLLMHLGNPKSILAWISLVTLGLGPNSTSADVIAILVGCGILGATIFFGYAVAFSTRPIASVYLWARRWIEGVLAIFFGCAGIGMLLSRG